MGVRENPFVPGVTQAERQLDDIIRIVFPDKIGQIVSVLQHPRCAIFRVAQQRKQETFNALGAVALKVVEDYFKQMKLEIREQRMTYALDMLLPDSEDDLPFVWRSFNRETKEKSGLWMHPFILTVMAEYMQQTTGAVKEYGLPRGALLLAVLAIHSRNVWYTG
ncbi:hypothetical protein K474DRAFT_914026 [Panus rudis PR-1116 ss-1]|nr:hypothetical protein K474DRAFT_914026 [Panus rudis PR-1116 ss-1]